jgi:hypothetical protein
LRQIALAWSASAALGFWSSAGRCVAALRCCTTCSRAIRRSRCYWIEIMMALSDLERLEGNALLIRYGGPGAHRAAGGPGDGGLGYDAGGAATVSTRGA